IVRLLAPARGQPQLTVGDIVELSVDFVQVVDVGVVNEKIVGDLSRTADVGERNVGNDLQRYGVDASLGNNVAGKGRLSRSVGRARAGVVDRVWRAAEIPAKFDLRRQRQNARIGIVGEIPLIAPEVEQLVADNVAANVPTRVIVHQVRRLVHTRG